MAITFVFFYICEDPWPERGDRINPCDSTSSVKAVGLRPLHIVEELSN